MLPKFIPKAYRSMIVTARRVDPNSDDAEELLERDFQKESRLQNQIQTDKVRAVKRIAQKIAAKKEFIKKAKGKSRKLLKKQLADLEVEQFELLRDEILNACKDSAGCIDEAKLARFPGSSGFIKKNLKKNKPKN